MSKLPKTQLQVFDLWEYDLWPDGEGGKMVNDCSYCAQITVRAKRKTYNENTEHEFTDYEVTDLQLNRALGLHGATWDGDSDYVLYATDQHGDPLCELRRVKGDWQ